MHLCLLWEVAWKRCFTTYYWPKWLSEPSTTVHIERLLVTSYTLVVIRLRCIICFLKYMRSRVCLYLKLLMIGGIVVRKNVVSCCPECVFWQFCMSIVDRLVFLVLTHLIHLQLSWFWKAMSIFGSSSPFYLLHRRVLNRFLLFVCCSHAKSI